MLLALLSKKTFTSALATKSMTPDETPILSLKSLSKLRLIVLDVLPEPTVKLSPCNVSSPAPKILPTWFTCNNWFAPLLVDIVKVSPELLALLSKKTSTFALAVKAIVVMDAVIASPNPLLKFNVGVLEVKPVPKEMLPFTSNNSLGFVFPIPTFPAV